jgi:aldehyde dehydrogenase (NAD+)
MTASSTAAVAMWPFLMASPKRLLIGGEWVDALAGGTFETVNPAKGTVLAHLAEGRAEDVDRAVAAARAAFEGPWSRTRPYDRYRLIVRLCELIERNFEELSTIDTLEMGMPITRSLAQRRRTLGRLHYYAALAQTIEGETIQNSLPGSYLSYTTREPIGVVGGIIPWNGPVGATMFKIGPTLATGCTMVLKPAEESSLSAIRLGELIEEADIPPGVINIVTGLGETAGARLAGHPDVDMIAFTGSTTTGQSIIRASAGNVKRLCLELGGKSPDIVFADADLDAAVSGAAMATFNNSGQICNAGTRLFVERPAYEEFVERVARYGEGLRIGDSMDPATELGPLVSEEQLRRVNHYLEAGKSAGAEVVSGGSQLTEGELGQGYFVPPTVFGRVTDDMEIARNEIFGPVLSALPFDDLDEVISRSNASLFGLGSGVWTKDFGKAHRVAGALRAGSVWVNCYQASDPAVPQGGYKMSGYGREGGKHHLDDYLNLKSVWMKAD